MAKEWITKTVHFRGEMSNGTCSKTNEYEHDGWRAHLALPGT